MSQSGFTTARTVNIQVQANWKMHRVLIADIRIPNGNHRTQMMHKKQDAVIRAFITVITLDIRAVHADSKKEHHIGKVKKTL